ncbi:hypothetical protein IMG5_042880, partial [Ichthyophthirius multifiliis]
NSAFFQMNFDDQENYKTELKLIDGNLRMKNNYKFQYTIDDYRLKTSSYLYIWLKNEKQIEVGYLPLQIYKIATGPFHYDMEMEWKNLNQQQSQVKVGRISFDIKMFQKIQFEIEAEKVSIFLENNQKDDNQKENNQKYEAYNFQFKIITYNNVFISDHSVNFLNKDLSFFQQIQNQLNQKS